MNVCPRPTSRWPISIAVVSAFVINAAMPACSSSSITVDGDPPPLKTPDEAPDLAHGKDAPADYELVFPDDRINRLDIAFEPASWNAMMDDMTSMAGDFGAGMVGMVPPELVEACEGKADGDDCQFEFNGQQGSGMCVQWSEGELVCGPKDPGGPPPELVEACAGKTEGDACEFTLGGEEGTGTCTTSPMDEELFCLPEWNGGDGADDAEFLPRRPMYVPTTVRFEGETWSNVGVRLKGNSTLMFTWSQGVYKLPFRVKFDEFEDTHPEIEDQRFYGFQSLSLTNNMMDPSFLREKVVSDILREGGVPTSRTAFVRVFVDRGEGPEYFGLYTLVEVPDKPMLKAQLGGDKGNLYKPHGKGARWGTFDPDSFEKQTNEKEGDFSDVKAAIAALNASRDDAAAWRQGLEATLDVDGFLRWLALNTAIGNWDVYGAIAHNYYLYGDPEMDGRLRWIPWDHDLAMAGPGGSLTHDKVSAAWPLIRYLLDDPVYRAAYLGHVDGALSGAFDPARVAERLTKAHALIAPYVVGPEGERPGFTFVASKEAFEDAFSGPMGILTYAKERSEKVKSELAAAK